MNPTPNEPSTDDDPRLLRAVQEYLAELEAGRRPDRRALAERFPDLPAAAMAPYLDALDAVHAASPLLQGPAEAPAAPAAPDAEALGDFRIVREIGRGGMGVVYEAVQRSLGRRVALKVLPFATALDAKRLQRFQHEAQAAAQLHHTNIVPVYAVGSERGVHFYAMQLIEGQNLAAFIDDLRRNAERGARSAELASAPRPAPRAPRSETRPEVAAGLSTRRPERKEDFFRTAARLTAQAAEGLDYAHEMGVIHRDVKPANLLVDGRGNVWITDFGLAHFHADAGLTQTGDLVGTLRYMSPEQAGGPRVLLDHRTDVYSLGATLYEMLTLRPIFDAADRQALLCQILCDEPRPPRAADASIPPELETIVLKALAKSPAERYATARDFADDLHRFLRHEPIRARRATLAQRARKWLRRHPSVPVAAAVLLVLLAAGSLVSAWLINGARERERRRAAEAEARLALALRLAEDLNQIAEVELADNPHLYSLRRRMLEASLAYYQEFIDQRRDHPGAQQELEVTRERVKKVLDDLSILQGAGQLFLLNSAAVLDDLGLSAEQRLRIDQLSQRMGEERREAFHEFYRLAPEVRQQRFAELARRNEQAVAEILRPEKLLRFRQIALQCQGPMAFRDPEVIAALKLTAEQRHLIRAVEADMFLARPDGARRGPPQGGPPTPGPRKGRDEMLKTAMAEIQKVLTDEQARKWKEMTGEPFDGTKPFFLPLPGFFGGPPPR